MTLQEYIDLFFNGGDLFQHIKFSDSYNEAKILESFCKTDLSRKKDKIRFREALSTILNELADQYYPEDMTNCFTEETLLYLIENNIALDDLAHLQLADIWLEKIYDKDNNCIEALQTLCYRNRRNTVVKV